MLTLTIILLFLGASLAGEQSEVFHPSGLKQHILSWAERAVQGAVGEVRQAANRLHELATMADNPNVKRLAELYQENRHFIPHCDMGYKLGQISSCINITSDIANITLLAIVGWDIADELGGSVVTLLNELNACSEESIFHQLSCYRQAFRDIQNDIREYSTDCNNFLSNSTVILKDFEYDVKKCFSFSEEFSTELIEANIQSCKSDLKGQHLL